MRCTSPLSFLFLLISPIVQGQELVEKSADCSGFHEKQCEGLPDGFKLNGQSKSALFAEGDTSELSFVAYSGHDYRVSVCQEELFSNELQFRILEKERKKETEEEMKVTEYGDTKDTTYEEKVRYREENVVLYDNEKDDNARSLEFSNPDNSRRLTIQVITKGESMKEDKLKTSDMGCVGVLIGHAPTRKTGF